ncbi:hemolysin III family protein [Aspergillus homomorphus CBS 101889]|uniref:MPR-like GPCR protein n=1 Tax=Aspergillus homomorphus (strain CBS 101889) TaxID=1450537 RepID=A0A395HN58_ASPHC|nr:mPR-like GPCR protein [Aspergillus homomorphus CBS 101889]RAL07704.1 mPR-like GPCR protein [Aspergillus homomorphus CBS 101889]
MLRQEQGNDSLSRRLARSPSKAAKARRVLLTFEQLPQWHQDNEYILHGYRPISGSARVSFCSWTYLHNESVNIYSHLIPAIVFLFSQWYLQMFLKREYPNMTISDHFIFAFFLLTAAICLGLSTTYHTMMNHSYEVEQLWLRFDLIGIVVLTIGDFVSGIYMVFWCEPLQRKIYWSMIGVLGLLTIFVMVTPRFQGPKFRLFRALTFVATGLSGFAPLIHGIKLFGISQMMIQSGMPYYLIEGAFLLTGALIYATKFPESRYPGRFDIYGSSHQLFHILVVFAAVTQLVGILNAFDYNYRNRTCS